MIIVITGPTGVGKTKMSIELAKSLNGEIINADAMQVYKGLDIGTAKIKEEEKESINHHLFDIKDPIENYTIYEYQKDLRKVIDKLKKDKIVPILVGGSGLYIKSALYDYKFNEEEYYDFSSFSDEELLKEIKKFKIDIDFDYKNRRRLERVLTKLKNNNYQKEKSELLYDNVIFIGLTTDKEVLYDIINQRVDKMVEEGLLEEVKNLYDKKIFSKAMNTGIGYKELYPYFKKEISLEEALNLIKQKSRKYAKRQYTFFKHQLPINWFNVNYDNFEETIEEVKKFIEKSTSQ